MGNVSKIAKHNLGGLVARLRDQGRTSEQILEAVNTHLAGKDEVSMASLNRFIATLPEKAVAVVHDPETTAVVKTQVATFAEQFEKLNRITQGWLDEAENARTLVVTDHGTQDAGPDWNARTKVAKELREQIKLMGDTMERIYNAEQVRLFQEAVLDAIGEVSPEVAQAIREKLREKTEFRRAALLGV